MSYPARLREVLTERRRRHIPFDQAWSEALAAHPVDPEWTETLSWLRQQFRSAYNRDESKRGRLKVEALTV